MSKYIEPRLRRDFGGVINAYVDFLKGDHKNLFKVFITYNFVFILLLFLTNYIADTGVSTLIALSSGTYMDQALDNSLETSFAASAIALVINLLVTLVNACLAGSYLRVYERDRSTNPNVKEVFHYAKKKLAGMFLIVLIGGIAVIPVGIASVIAIIIPIIGVLFIFPVIMISYFTWLGLSMFSYAYDENLDAVAALGVGWNLLFSKFWKAIGVSFIVSILLYIMSALFQLVPTGLIWFISYNSSGDNVELEENVLLRIVKFIFYALNSVSGMLVYFLIMFMIGYLYFNLHESKYNVFLKNRIAKLGARDEE